MPKTTAPNDEDDETELARIHALCDEASDDLAARYRYLKGSLNLKYHLTAHCLDLPARCRGKACRRLRLCAARDAPCILRGSDAFFAARGALPPDVYMLLLHVAYMAIDKIEGRPCDPENPRQRPEARRAGGGRPLDRWRGREASNSAGRPTGDPSV